MNSKKEKKPSHNSKSKKDTKTHKVTDVVSQDEVEIQVSKEFIKNIDKKNQDDEPRWYHYLIVSLCFIAFFVGLYFALDYFEKEPQNPNINIKLYTYNFKVGERNGSIQFYTPTDKIEDLDYPIEVSKHDFLNSKRIILSFMEYNGTDNGEVTLTSGRLAPFIRHVYLIDFDPYEDIKHINESNCSTSTLNEKVVTFNPYSDRNGVYYDESNGCIEFLTNNATKMRELGDKFFYTIINE